MKNSRIKNMTISIIFVIFFSAAVSFFAFYAAAPADNKRHFKNSSIAAESPKQQEGNAQKNSSMQHVYNTAVSQKPVNTYYAETAQEQQRSFHAAAYNAAQPASAYPSERLSGYDSLLDELAEYSPQSSYAAVNIVNKLLEFKGYPADLVKTSVKDIDESGTASIDSSMLANFNFFTGEMTVSRKMIYELDIKTIIAVIAHELDHFDKLASICKSIGIDDFSRLYTDNGRFGLNISFWNEASKYADISSFNSKLYTDALKRFLTQQNLEHTSSYSDFYRLAENMRNPIEESGYKQSDYVFNHFGITPHQGAMKLMSNAFDTVDRELDALISGKPALLNEKTALFDYFFAEAAIDILPELSPLYEQCINENGDLTKFWLQFEGRFPDFYRHASISDSSKDTLINILNITGRKIQNGITPEETAKALQYKINTLKSNLVYDGAVKHLRKTCSDYLYYIKEKNIQNPAQELETLLLLICIDNKYYKNNLYFRISLENTNLPPEAVKICSAENSCTDYMFIYNNPSFREKTADMSKDDEGRLIELLNRARLDVRARQTE